MPQSTDRTTAPSWPACETARTNWETELGISGGQSAATLALAETYSDLLRDVYFEIDYTMQGVLAGCKTFKVLTMFQARVALGY